MADEAHISVEVAYHCAQRVRDVFHQDTPAQRRRAVPPRRGRGPDQAPGDRLDANPGAPGDPAEAGDSRGAGLSSVDLLGSPDSQQCMTCTTSGPNGEISAL